MENDKRIWTVPNFLSFLRLVFLVPILLYMARGQKVHALAFIFLGFSTDFIDGWIARRFNQRSDLGRMMDPVIDKLNILGASLLMVLSPLYRFPLWFFLFLVGRELAVVVFGLWLVRRRKIVPEANKPGKRSAFFTGVSVLLYILDYQPWAAVAMWIAFVLALYSTGTYLQVFRKVATGRPAPPSSV